MKERLARWLQSQRAGAQRAARPGWCRAARAALSFLGFTFRWQQSKKGNAYVHIEPSPAAEQALRDRVRGLTHRRTTWRAAARGRARDQPSDAWLGQLLCPGPLSPQLPAD